MRALDSYTRTQWYTILYSVKSESNQRLSFSFAFDIVVLHPYFVYAILLSHYETCSRKSNTFYSVLNPCRRGTNAVLGLIRCTLLY